MGRVPGANDRVAAAAAAAGLQISIQRFPEGTRTAEDAARAVGCKVAQIVKSLVFVADGRPVLALISGDDRLDPGRLATILGAQRVDRADGDAVRDATGFAIGGVPPIGHVRPLPILMDRRLLDHTEVWAAAGRPDAVFSVAPEHLRQASGAQVADIAVHRSGD
jgi:Cys-tRNA(Pro) deacylase